MNLALKDIGNDIVRFTLATLGVGAILVATIGINGLYRGVVYEALLIVNNFDADLWVVQGDGLGPFTEKSYVSGSLDNRLEGVPGVREARRFIEFNKQFLVDGQRKGITIVGLDYPKDHGEWLTLIDGRRLEAGHYEAIADKSLGAVVGDVLRLGRDDYSVVGIVSGQVDPGGDPLLFVTIVDAQAIDLFAPSEAVLLNRQSRSLSPNPSAQKAVSPRWRSHWSRAPIPRPYGNRSFVGEMSTCSRAKKSATPCSTAASGVSGSRFWRLSSPCLRWPAALSPSLFST